MSTTNFGIGDHVKVCWLDKKHIFCGTIQAEFADAYDILYDDLVDGKQCVEKNVTPSRIVHQNSTSQNIDENIFSSISLLANKVVDNDRVSKEPLLTSFHLFCLHVKLNGKFISLPCVYEVEKTDGLTVALKDSGMSQDTWEFVQSQLSGVMNAPLLGGSDIQTSANAKDSVLLKTSVLLESSLYRDVTGLNVHSINHTTEEIVSRVHSKLLALTCFMTMIRWQHKQQVIEQEVSRAPVTDKTKMDVEDENDDGLQSVYLSEELLEMGVLLVIDCLKVFRDDHYSLSVWYSSQPGSINKNSKKAIQSRPIAANVDYEEDVSSANGTEKPSDDLESCKTEVTSSISTLTKSQIAKRNKFCVDIGTVLVPQLITIGELIVGLLMDNKQSDRRVALFCELALAVLMTDVTLLNHSTSGMVLSPITVGSPTSQISSSPIVGSSLLLSLHERSAIIMQLVFISYANHRNSMLHDALPLLMHLYNNHKIIPKPVSICNQQKTLRGAQETTKKLQDTSSFVCQNHISTPCWSILGMLLSVACPADRRPNGAALLFEEGVDTNGFVHQYKQVAHWCDCLVNELVKRCVQKDMSVDYRNVLQQFVIELLNVTLVGTPFWYIAEVLLERFTTACIREIQNPSSQLVLDGVTTSKKGIGNSYVVFLLDMASFIAATLKQGSLKPLESAREKSVKKNVSQMMSMEIIESKTSELDSGISVERRNLTLELTNQPPLSTSTASAGNFHLKNILPSYISAEVVHTVNRILDEFASKCVVEDSSIGQKVKKSKKDVKSTKNKSSKAKATATSESPLDDGSDSKQPSMSIADLTLGLHCIHQVLEVVMQAFFDGNVPLFSVAKSSSMTKEGSESSLDPVVAPVVQFVQWVLHQVNPIFPEQLSRVMEIFETCDVIYFMLYRGSVAIHQADEMHRMAGEVTVCDAIKPVSAPYSLTAHLYVHSMYHLLINWFKDIEYKDKDVEHSGQSSSLSRERKLLRSSFVRSLLPKLASTGNPSGAQWKVIYSQEWAQACHLSLLHGSLIHRSFEKVLLLSLSMAEGSIPAIRARSIRSLSSLINTDVTLLSRESVRHCMTEHLFDDSISVREEAVKLIGHFISLGCALSNEYLNGLLLKMNDIGISVRKTVVLILRNLLALQPTHPLYSNICVRLLERGFDPAEEDNVKDIIVETFHVLWFTPIVEKTMDCGLLIDTPQADITESAAPQVPLSINIPSTVDTVGIATPKDSSFAGISPLSTVPDTPSRSPRQTSHIPIHTPSADRKKAASCASIGSLDTTSTIAPLTNEASIHGAGKSGVLIRANSVNESLAVTFADVTRSHLRGRHDGDDALRKYILSVVNSPSVTTQPIASHSPKEKHQMNVKYMIEAITMQVIDVVMNCDSQDLLESLIREVTVGKGEGNESQEKLKNKRRMCVEQCNKIVKSLVEMVLKTEERNDLYLTAAKREYEPQLIGLFSTLAIFCKAYPSLVIKHMETFLPFLKAENGLSRVGECTVCTKIMTMLTSLVQVESNMALRSRYNEVMVDLSTLTFKLTAPTALASVACMAKVSYHTARSTARLLQLAQKCIDTIISCSVWRRQQPTAPLNSRLVAHLQRSILVIGYICSHMRLLRSVRTEGPSAVTVASPSTTDASTRNDAPVTNLTDIQLATCDMTTLQNVALSFNQLPGVCYAAATFLLKQLQVKELQTPSVQALCSVFIGTPKLLLHCNNTGLLSDVLHPYSPYSPTPPPFVPELYQKVLISLRDMLETEEKRLEQAASLLLLSEAKALNETDDNSKVSKTSTVRSDSKSVGETGVKVLGPGSSESDATAAGFILQQHLPSILSYLSHPVATMRYSALLLIGALLRQGMICPLDIMGPLIALQGDSVEELRTCSLQLLQVEDMRHPSFLDNRLVEGVELARSYQMLVTGHSTCSHSAADESTKTSCFGPLYLACILSSRKRRHDSMSALLRRCSVNLQLMRDSCVVVPTPVVASSSTADSVDGSGLNKTSGRLISSPNVSSHTVTSDRARLSQNRDRMLDVDYLVSLIALLPMEYAEDPLSVIYWVNRTVPLLITHHLTEFKGLLHSLGGRSVTDMPPPPPRPVGNEATEDNRERTSGLKSKDSIKKKTSSLRVHEDAIVLQDTLFVHFVQQEYDLQVQNEAKRLKIKTFDFDAFEDEMGSSSSGDSGEGASTALWTDLEILGMMGHSLISLLELKRFMKLKYGLSDEKCGGYSPVDKVSSVSPTEKLRTDSRMCSIVLPIMQYESPLFESGFSMMLESPATESTPNVKLGKENKANIEHLPNERFWSVVQHCIDQYNALLLAVDSDEQQSDFSLSVSVKKIKESSKRKRGRPSANNGEPVGAEGSVGGTTGKSNKKKVAGVNKGKGKKKKSKNTDKGEEGDSSSDDDYMDEDEAWEE